MGRFGSKEFVAYFLATLVVRQLTGTWLIWEMNQDIRSGALSQRLLKPIHPLLVYSAQGLGASGRDGHPGRLPGHRHLVLAPSTGMINCRSTGPSGG